MFFGVVATLDKGPSGDDDDGYMDGNAASAGRDFRVLELAAAGVDTLLLVNTRQHWRNDDEKDRVGRGWCGKSFHFRLNLRQGVEVTSERMLHHTAGTSRS